MLKLLMRRSEACAFLGVGEYAMAKLIKGKQLTPVKPIGNNSLMFFRTIELLKLGGLKDEADIKKLGG